MRHSTWLKLQASPAGHRLYRRYRVLPDWVRALARAVLMPRWSLAAAYVRNRARGAVLSGPFKGTELELSPTSERQLLGYLLGTQELELREICERIIETRYPTIINIGVADGYYAIGFARRMPEAQIVGFEAIQAHHAGIRRTAERNGVADRIRLEGYCSPGDLAREVGALRTRALILADIEGGELELLDPEALPPLRHVDLLVETHDEFAPRCTDTLVERFAITHDIEQIVSRPRVLSDFPSSAAPALAALMPTTATALMDERRAGTQTWLFLRAKEPLRTEDQV